LLRISPLEVSPVMDVCNPGADRGSRDCLSFGGETPVALGSHFRGTPDLGCCNSDDGLREMR
jgi:hypothetical protein